MTLWQKNKNIKMPQYIKWICCNKTVLYKTSFDKFWRENYSSCKHCSKLNFLKVISWKSNKCFIFFCRFSPTFYNDSSEFSKLSNGNFNYINFVLYQVFRRKQPSLLLKCAFFVEFSLNSCKIRFFYLYMVKYQSKIRILVETGYFV